MTSTDRRYGVAEGLPYKAPCRVATTANIVLSGLQTINGVTLVEGDRVLVKDQTDTTENGIYSAASTGWSRTVDADGPRDLVNGTKVFVVTGTVDARTSYFITTSNPITIGTSSIVFSDTFDKERTYIPLTKFGVIMDAVGNKHSNVSLLNSAFDSGEPLWLPPTWLFIDEPVYSGSASLVLRGAGAQKSYLYLTAPDQDGIVINSSSGAEIAGIGFASNVVGGQTEGAAINVDPGSGNTNSSSKFDALHFFSSLFTGINTERAAYWSLSRSDFIQLKGPNVIVQNKSNPDAGDSEITKCLMMGPPGALTTDNVGILHKSSGGLRVHSNKILTMYDGYRLQAAAGSNTGSCMYEDNSIEGATNACMKFTADDPTTTNWNRMNIGANELLTTGTGKGVLITAASTPGWLQGVDIGPLTLQCASGGVGVDADYVTNLRINGGTYYGVGSGSSIGLKLGSNVSGYSIIPPHFTNWVTNIQDSATSLQQPPRKYGFTGTDMSATGGTGHLVRQASAGGAFTTSALALSDTTAIRVPFVSNQAATKTDLTGTTAQTSIIGANIPLTANPLSTTGAVEIEVLWSFAGSAGVKTVHVTFGGTQIQVLQVAATCRSLKTLVRIQNRGATNSQVTSPSSLLDYGTENTNSPSTLAIDTTANVTILLRGTLANSADTISVESYGVRVLP